MKVRLSVLLFVLLSSTMLLSPATPMAAEAKNIVLLIGDGFGPSQFRAAQLYSQRVLGKDLKMVEVMNTGRTAFLLNDTADSMVTESAAAAGQIATGQLMVARALSMAEDRKTPVQTVLEAAKAAKGISTGLVTTSGITDATPAAFASHVPHRSDEATVADQELKLGVDVLMGGRKKFFLPKAVAGGKRTDGRNLMEEAAKAGYTVVETRDELLAAKGDKVLGLFNMGNLAYEIDRAATKEPSLAEMTDATLKILSRNPKGFFAMIEAGRIDHASHRNDIAGTIGDAIAFDDAVSVAYDFAKKNPGTLLIVTADHETAGLGLIGRSKVDKEYVGIDLKAVQRAKRSFELIVHEWGKTPSAATIKASVKQNLGIGITDQEAQFVADDQLKKAEPFNYTYDYMHSLAFVLRPYYRVGWASQTHTASPLFLVAYGPGAERAHGIMHNTQIHTMMTAALLQ